LILPFLSLTKVVQRLASKQRGRRAWQPCVHHAHTAAGLFVCFLGYMGALGLSSDPAITFAARSHISTLKRSRNTKTRLELTTPSVSCTHDAWSQLKPDAAERRAIAALLRLPPTRPLPPDGKHLLWKFRFSLKADAPALTKFLKCVDWNDAHETKQVRGVVW